MFCRSKVKRQDLRDLNRKITNIKIDLLLREHPKEFTDSIMKPGRSALLQIEHTMAWFLSGMLVILLKNSDNWEPLQCQGHFQNETYILCDGTY
jgi:hypothetical protein